MNGKGHLACEVPLLEDSTFFGQGLPALDSTAVLQRTAALVDRGSEAFRFLVPRTFSVRIEVTFAMLLCARAARRMSGVTALRMLPPSRLTREIGKASPTNRPVKVFAFS